MRLNDTGREHNTMTLYHINTLKSLVYIVFIDVVFEVVAINGDCSGCGSGSGGGNSCPADSGGL